MTTSSDKARDRLIVALDVPSVDEARNLVARLGDEAVYYKIGHQLAFAGGLEMVRELKEAGKKVFLDMKLLDIDNTVEKGVSSICGMGVDMLTIHAYPKAMRAAVRAANGTGICLLGVTVLTSMDDNDLADAGYSGTAKELVLRRVADARNAGMGGIVCSAAEAKPVREIVGPQMAVVTPGIRPSGADAGDQKRVVTPRDAISSGASHLVVGRPIVAADDPESATAAILREISDALSVK